MEHVLSRCARRAGAVGGLWRRRARRGGWRPRRPSTPRAARRQQRHRGVLYHLPKAKYCLEEWFGLAVSEPPPVASFHASGGTNWDPWQEAIEKYNAIAEDLSDEVNVLPYGPITGSNADDHVHIDLGYMTLIPREISEDRMEQPQENRPRFAFEERRRKERRGATEPAES